MSQHLLLPNQVLSQQEPSQQLIIAQSQECKTPFSLTIAVTPDLARFWLEKTPEVQRSKSRTIVAKYADVMRKGQWQLTHQGICFDVNGKLIDGQHRLEAICESGATVEMLVSFNMPSDTFVSIDRGYKRTLTNIAQISGSRWCSTWAVAAANTLLWDCTKLHTIHKTWSAHDLPLVLSYFDKELELTFPSAHSGSSQMRNASVRGAVLRAFISKPEKHKRISEFVVVVASNAVVRGTEDNIALRLKERIARVKGSTHLEIRATVFGLTLSALNLFLDGKDLKYIHNLKPPRVQPFPIFVDKMTETDTFEVLVKRLEREQQARSLKSRQ